MGFFNRRKKRETAAEDLTQEASAPRTQSAPRGPFDLDDAPEVERIDFGGMQIPPREGMEIALEVAKATRSVSGLTISYKNSAVQLNAFAAPKSESLWEEVRQSLRQSIAQQGGTTETREGEFGTELFARIPVHVKGAAAKSHRPMRFLGIDGPRWMLRAVISGAALQNDAVRAELEEIIRSIVVVRGRSPMAPKEVLELTVPGEKPQVTNTPDAIDPLAEGPTIAEVR